MTSVLFALKLTLPVKRNSWYVTIIIDMQQQILTYLVSGVSAMSSYFEIYLRDIYYQFLCRIENILNLFSSLDFIGRVSASSTIYEDRKFKKLGITVKLIPRGR
jgi:hypothetical protein